MNPLYSTSHYRDYAAKFLEQRITCDVPHLNASSANSGYMPAAYTRVWSMDGFARRASESKAECRSIVRAAMMANVACAGAVSSRLVL